MRKLLLALLLVPAVASAGGYSVPNVVSRDLAMSDSLVADQTGAGAVYRNPAALSRLSGLDLTLNVSMLGNGVDLDQHHHLLPVARLHRLQGGDSGGASSSPGRERSPVTATASAPA